MKRGKEDLMKLDDFMYETQPYFAERGSELGEFDVHRRGRRNFEGQQYEKVWKTVYKRNNKLLKDVNYVLGLCEESHAKPVATKKGNLRILGKERGSYRKPAISFNSAHGKERKFEQTSWW